jgi:drug/metabolite transporter (DMT)-like permease
MLARLINAPYTLLVITTFLWGANAVAGRLAVDHISPMLLSSMRWIVSLVLLAPVLKSWIGEDGPLLRRHWLQIGLLGAVGYTLFSVLNYTAAHYTTAVNIGIIQGSMPVMVLIGAFFAFRTPVSGLQWLGVGVTTAGVVLLACRGDLATLKTLSFNTGDMLMVLASVFYGGYTVAVRARPAVSAKAFFIGATLGAFATSLPFVAYEIAAHQFLWPDMQGWIIVLFAAIFPSIIGQILFVRAIGQVGPGRAGLFINLVPVFGALLGYMIGEPFAAYHAVALAMVLGGIAVAESGKRLAGIT